MPSGRTPELLKKSAEEALAAGDHMTAMDLYGDAAELAWEKGLTAFADECALRVNEVIAQIAEIEQIQLPETIQREL